MDNFLSSLEIVPQGPASNMFLFGKGCESLHFPPMSADCISRSSPKSYKIHWVFCASSQSFCSPDHTYSVQLFHLQAPS